ncbi:hypothetical protein GCM10010207_20050 [Streptomyces atratus]|nr:hypothetical protein GCM10010207_20050 [Streptomyces atratus]
MIPPPTTAYDAEMVALAREEPKRNAMATADYRTPHGGRALAQNHGIRPAADAPASLR